jgi:hypothetical protein
MRYKCWRSNADKELHVICHEGALDSLPSHIRRLGPWHGSKEGEIERLKPAYRAQLIPSTQQVLRATRDVVITAATSTAQ